MKDGWTEKFPRSADARRHPAMGTIRNGRSVRAGTDQPSSEGARASGAARRTNCQLDSQSSGCSGADTINVDSSTEPGSTNCKQMKHRQTERSGAITLDTSLAGLITPDSKRLHASREHRSFLSELGADAQVSVSSTIPAATRVQYCVAGNQRASRKIAKMRRKGDTRLRDLD